MEAAQLYQLLSIAAASHVPDKMKIYLNGVYDEIPEKPDGARVPITCTLDIRGEIGARIESDVFIWRTPYDGVSTTVQQPRGTWYDPFKKDGRVPNTSRMTEGVVIRESTTFLQIRLIIEAVDWEDAGMFMCRGSYVSRRGKRVVLESRRVILKVDAAPEETTTWMNVNNKMMYVYQQSDKTTSILCYSSLTSSTYPKMIRQRIYKYQSFPMNLHVERKPQSFYGWNLIYDSASPWSVPDTRRVEPKWITSKVIASGLNVSGWKVQHSGLYYCNAIYRNRANEDKSEDSLVVAFDANGPLRINLVVLSNHDSGIPNSVPQLTADGINSENYPSRFQIITVNCQMVALNEIPQFKLTMDKEDVTRSANTSGSHSQFSNFNNVSKGFSAMRYVTIASYSGKTAEICKYRVVTCISWKPSNPDRPQKRSKRLAPDLCEPRKRKSRIPTSGSAKTKAKPKNNAKLSQRKVQ